MSGAGAYLRRFPRATVSSFPAFQARRIPKKLAGITLLYRSSAFTVRYVLERTGAEYWYRTDKLVIDSLPIHVRIMLQIEMDLLQGLLHIHSRSITDWSASFSLIHI